MSTLSIHYSATVHILRKHYIEENGDMKGYGRVVGGSELIGVRKVLIYKTKKLHAFKTEHFVYSRS